MYDMSSRYKGQCSVYRKFEQDMHTVRNRIDVLNEYECIHVPNMRDVRGRYKNQH